MRFLPAVLLLCALGVAGAEPVSDILRNKAAQGNPAAMVQLGDEYFFGINRRVNRILGAYWYQAASRKNSLQGSYKYGLCLLNGWGVTADKRSAFEFFIKAQRYAPAGLQLGKMLFEGVPGNSRLKPIPANRQGGVNILRKLNELHYAPARMELVHLLEQDPELRRKHGKEILQLCGEQFKGGDRSTVFLLYFAGLLQEGLDGKPAPVLARALLEVAAESGDSVAQRTFAEALEYGRGCPPDPERALDYYRKAALSGDPGALTRIGDYRLAGQYMLFDAEAARQNFAEAAQKNWSPAWRKLGWCYENGIGTEKNLRLAYNAYDKAARGGDTAALYHVGRCFKDGIGVPADPSGAVFFFRRGTAKGDPQAMLALGKALIQGNGCSRDYSEGYAMVKYSAAAGNIDARKLLATLTPPAPPVQAEPSFSIPRNSSLAPQKESSGLRFQKTAPPQNSVSGSK